MSTQHSFIATIGMGDPDIGAEGDFKITFNYTKGSPAQGPSYASGGQPADPEEIEFVKAEAYCNGKPSPPYGAFADMEQQSIDALADSWLESDEGQVSALECVNDSTWVERKIRGE